MVGPRTTPLNVAIQLAESFKSKFSSLKRVLTSCVWATDFWALNILVVTWVVATAMMAAAPPAIRTSTSPKPFLFPKNVPIDSVFIRDLKELNKKSGRPLLRLSIGLIDRFCPDLVRWQKRHRPFIWLCNKIKHNISTPLKSDVLTSISLEISGFFDTFNAFELNNDEVAV